jgi:hypothetical protein
LSGTFQYRLWDYRVVSDFDLGELEAASEIQPFLGAMHVVRAAGNGWAFSGEHALEYRYDNGDLWQASWNAGDHYISRFPQFGSFRIQPPQMRIECAPNVGAAESTIAHLILDHAIPRLLSLKPGYLVLHASALQVENRTIAILGNSGKGKSTLAAWFGSRGYPLLTDDCLVLRKDGPAQLWLAQPSYHSVRLWPESVNALGIDESALREFAHYSSKRRTGKAAEFRFATGGSVLAACFVLADSESETKHPGAPAVRRLSVNDAFLELARAVFRLDAENEQVNRAEFEVLTGLVDTAPFWSLSYERKFEWLPEVEKVIIQTMQAAHREILERERP